MAQGSAFSADETFPSRYGAAWPDVVLGLLMHTLNGIKAWTTNVAHSNTALQLEWLEFVEARLKKDVELPTRLAACRCPDDVWQTYSGFIKSAIDDYQGEITELTRIGGTIAGDSRSSEAPAVDRRPTTAH